MKPIEEDTITKGWFGTETEYTTLWYDTAQCGATRTSKPQTPKRKQTMTVPTVHQTSNWSTGTMVDEIYNVYDQLEAAEPHQPAHVQHKREVEQMETNMDAMINLTKTMSRKGAHLVDANALDTVVDATSQALHELCVAFEAANLKHIGSDMADAINHAIYRQTLRYKNRVAQSRDELRSRIREEDGPESGGAQLERAQARSLGAERNEQVWEAILEAAEHQYLTHQGKPWNPNAHFKYQWATTNASHIAAEAYITKRSEQESAGATPQKGEAIGIVGGFRDGKAYYTVNKVTEKLQKLLDTYGESLVLALTDERGPNEVAARWAKEKGIAHYLISSPSTQTGSARAFARNNALLKVSPKALLVFAGPKEEGGRRSLALNGPAQAICDKARAAGLPRHMVR